MTAQSILNALVSLVADHEFLGRLLFTSLEFATLALLVGALIFIFRLCQPRLRALLWLMVLAKPLVGLALGTPLPLFLLSLPTPPVVTVAPEPLIDTPPPNLTLISQQSFAAPVEPPAPPVDVAALALKSALGLWLAGCALMALRLLVNYVRLRRLIRVAAAPAPWLECRLAEAARSLKVEGGLPRLRVTAELESPALAGFWRPVILMPVWICEEADPLQVDWSLRHELMHWRLRDPLASLVRELVRILFFFHPAAWWAGRKWQQATEMACDRALIHSMEDAEMYVQELYRMLLKVRAQRRVPVAGGLFAGRTQISQRIASLVKDPLRAPARLSAATVGLVLALSAVSLSVGLGVKSQAAEEKPTGAPTSQTVTMKAAPGTHDTHFNLFELIQGGSMAIDEEHGATQIEGQALAIVKLGASSVELRGDALNTSVTQGGQVALRLTDLNGKHSRSQLLKMGGNRSDSQKSQFYRVTAGKAFIAKDKIILTENALVVPEHGQPMQSETFTLTPDAKTGELHIESSSEKVPIEAPPYRPMLAKETRKKAPFIYLTWKDVKLEPVDPADVKKGLKLVLTASGVDPQKRMAPIVVTGRTVITGKDMDGKFTEAGKELIAIKGAVKVSDGKTLEAKADELVCAEQDGHVVLTLTGNPEVIQERGMESNGKRKKMRAQADKIVIEPSGEGQPRVSMLMSPGSKNKPKIEVIGAGKSKANSSVTSATFKIPLPQITRSVTIPVCDEAGKPMAGVEVYLIQHIRKGQEPANLDRQKLVMGPVRTDAQGNATFFPSVMEFENYAMNAYARIPGKMVGFMVKIYGEHASQTPRPLEVTMHPVTRIQGLVTAPAGYDLSKITVRVLCFEVPETKGWPEELARLPWPSSTTPDKQGRYALTDLPQTSRILLVVDGPGLARTLLGGATPDDPKAFKIRMEPEAVIEGRVRNTDGQPVAGVTVVATPFGWSWLQLPFKATTDQAGHFVFKGVLPERYAVRVLMAGNEEDVRAGMSQTVSVKSGQTARGIDLKVASEGATAQKPALTDSFIQFDAAQGVMTYDVKNANRLLDKVREMIQSHHWKVEEEAGHESGAVEGVTITASDSYGKRVTFTATYKGGTRGEMRVAVEPGAQLSVPEVINELARQWAVDNNAKSVTVSDADKLAAEDLAATGWRLWGQRKLPEAEASFKKALEKDPNEANTWNGLGWAQQNQGKALNAKNSFEECLKRDPKHAAALNGLGWIAKGEKKTDEAIAYWKLSVEALPQATAALTGLAQTYMEQKNYKEAQRIYEQWLKAEPNSAEAKDGLERAKAGAAGSPRSD